MSSRGDSSLTSHYIDGLAFARSGQTLNGVTSTAHFLRLPTNAVMVPSGELRYTISGHHERGKCWLLLSIEGSLGVECQRCGGNLSLPIDINARLLLVPPGKDFPEDEILDDTFDALRAEEELDLMSLIEEEVLLALPFAPMHDNCTVYVSPQLGEHTSSLFLALKEIKKGV